MHSSESPATDSAGGPEAAAKAAALMAILVVLGFIHQRKTPAVS